MPISFDGKKGEFSSCVSHFMSKTSKQTGKKHTSASARKVCGSLQASQEKEHKYCGFGKIQIKEDEGDFHVSGFVATSHPDRAASEDGRFAGDIIPKNTIQKIVNDINNKYKPQAGAVSERHDHIRAQDLDLPIAGVLTPNTTAVLQQLDDGEWGAHVDTILSKTNPRYEEVKTNIEQGIYPGFSIEYENTEFVPIEKEGKMYRLLTDLDTEGFGYAHRRKIANPHAEYTSFGYKEIKGLHNPEEDKKRLKNKKNKGDKMKSKEEETPTEGEDKPAEDAPAEPAPAEDKPAEDKPAESAPAEEPSDTEEKEVKVSAEDAALIKEVKRQKAEAAKVKELEPIIAKRVRAEIKELRTKGAPIFTNNEGKKEFKEFDAYQESLAEMQEVDKPLNTKEAGAGEMRLSRFQRTIDRQFKEAGRLCDGLIDRGINVWTNWKQKEIAGPPADLVPEPLRNAGIKSSMKEVNNRIECKEFNRFNNIEMKAGEGAQVDTNLADSNWTYGSYYLSPVELNDIFQPVLVNQLNDQTTTYGRLTKEDWSGRSQIQFRARTGRNSTVGGYNEGANLTYGSSFTGTVGRKKFQQPFCYYRVLVAVTGQAQRFSMAPGGMGDRWADEIKWSGQDLLAAGGTKGTATTGLNTAILGSGNGTAENISLGFEGLILGTTGTLYGKDLSNEGTLRAHKDTLSTVNISLEKLREMIRDVQTGTGTTTSEIFSNSRVSDLVFFTHHIQIDFVKAIYQDLQRIVPTSGRVGFEGELSIDGIPMVADRQIETDDVFLINTANTKIGVNLPPTLEPLPVTADAQAAHIKTYFNLYSDAPGNNYWVGGFAIT